MWFRFGLVRLHFVRFNHFATFICALFFTFQLKNVLHFNIKTNVGAKSIVNNYHIRLRCVHHAQHAATTYQTLLPVFHSFRPGAVTIASTLHNGVTQLWFSDTVNSVTSI
jgi:hypothetical protein